MNNYIEVDIPVESQVQKDLLIAQLTEYSFEGFEETPRNLRAFIPEADFDETQVKAIIDQHHLTYTKTVIPQTNWNASWESSFEPVVVDGFCSIRAAFHPPVAGTKYDIIITPKMSFGTGHHATTYMMITAMEGLGLAGKSVADFGTGTGVLAILAEKMGAAAIDAIDNDDWSIANGRENLEMNACRLVRLSKTDSFKGLGSYDVILANINRHVILAQLPFMKENLLPGGMVVVSGILADDYAEVVRSAALLGLHPVSRNERGSWMCVQLAALKV